MEVINKIPVSPEEYGEVEYNKIPETIFHQSLMNDVERRFVFGLVDFFKPERILEIGVAGGGGSALLLEMIKERKGAQLVSVDLAEYVYSTNVPIGQTAIDLYPNGNPQWKLFTGKDPSQILDELNGKFDFLILDTAHIHPIESLNFLCSLPHLSDNAIVVLHDIGSYRSAIDPFSHFPKAEFACKLLYDIIVAEKLRPKDSEYRKRFPFSNIGAFQISEDTKRYIGNIFTSLEFPWGLYPSQDILDSLNHCMETHYSQENFEIFKIACAENKRLYDTGFKSFFDQQYFDVQRMMQGVEKVVFYGKRKAKEYLSLFRNLELALPYEIWDNYESGNVEGIPVVKPRNDLSDGTSIVFSMRYNDLVESLIPTVQANVIRVDVLIREMEDVF
ncbi:class I SAM-dependent methyltransferase [Lacrimispora sp.]|uniref:class I SAM-dependent methyltransferase n=1 Tax=Lacrimispora sp. TaxID=2719234 RepID=UPI003460EA30